MKDTSSGHDVWDAERGEAGKYGSADLDIRDLSIS